jgi:hypothetical protein
MMENFEILVHSILICPDQPAVLLFGHFFAGPDSIVAQFYNILHIRVKSAIFPITPTLSTSTTSILLSLP